MRERQLARLLIVAATVLLLFFLFQPNLRGYFFSASTPREVQPRGALAEFERTAIELFERTSPSVVQVVVVRQQMDPRMLMEKTGLTCHPKRLAPAQASCGIAPAMSSRMRTLSATQDELLSARRPVALCRPM